MKHDTNSLQYNIARLAHVAGTPIRSMSHARDLLAKHGHRFHVLLREQLANWCRPPKAFPQRIRRNANVR